MLRYDHTGRYNEVYSETKHYMWWLQMQIDVCCIGHLNAMNGIVVSDVIFPESWAILDKVSNQTKYQCSFDLHNFIF